MSKEARAYASTVRPPTRCAATSLEVSMSFHITQSHTPQTCPLGEGGSDTLFNADEPGVRLLGRYGANSEHTMSMSWRQMVEVLHRSSCPGSSAQRAR